jgi:hypothetical protein
MKDVAMNACIIDKNSGQWKMAFTQIFREARVLTDRNTAIPTPNWDTSYSLPWMDLRAEPQKDKASGRKGA